jgi:hypothetical protein
MIGPLLLLAATQAAQTPSLASRLGCSLSTPYGEAVAFTVDRSDSRSIVVAPGAGTVWPAATLTGVPAAALRPTFLAAHAFGFGNAPEGPVLHLGTPSRDARWQSATVYWRNGRQLVRPVAFGYCILAAIGGEGTVSVAAPVSQALAAPFDAARWHDDSCTLMTRDGRRTSLDYHWDRENRFRMKAAGIWADPGVTVVRQPRDTRPGQPSVAIFGVPKGPAGTEMSFIDEKNMIGSRLVQFQRLGSTNAAAGDEGFAICGYRIFMGEVMER